MADPTTPAGGATPAAPSSPATLASGAQLSAASVEALTLSLKEFEERFKAIQTAIKEGSVGTAKEMQEKLVGGVRAAREGSKIEFETFQKYITDLKSAYSTLAESAERSIREIIIKNEELAQEEKIAKEKYKIIYEEKIKLLDDYKKKYNELIGVLSADDSIEVFNEKLNKLASQQINLLNSESIETAKSNLEDIKNGYKEIFSSAGLNEEEAKKSAAIMFEIQEKLKNNIPLTKEQGEYQQKINEYLALNLEFAQKINANKEKQQEQMQHLLDAQLEEQDAIKSTIQQILSEELKQEAIKEKQAAIQQKLNDLKKQEALAMEPILRMDKMRAESLENVNKSFGGFVDKLMPGSTNTNAFSSAMLSLSLSTD